MERTGVKRREGRDQHGKRVPGVGPEGSTDHKVPHNPHYYLGGRPVKQERREESTHKERTREEMAAMMAAKKEKEKELKMQEKEEKL